MGAICGALGGEAPEINVDPATIAEATATAVENLVKAIPEKEAEFRREVDKCGDDGKFEVPDTKIVLTKSSTDEEFKQAAVAASFADEGRTQVKDAVWASIEPTIDEQLDGVPSFVADKAKDKFREAAVDPVVDKALDEALKKAKGESAE